MLSDTLIDKRELRDVELAARIEVARKVGILINKAPAGDERESAMELARLLVEDASISVREALSRQLRECSFLPEDIIEKLAADIDQVSVPFVIASTAISEVDLENLVEDGSATMQEAIASREQISEALAFAICDIAEVEAVSTLMGNEGADLSERSYKRAVDRFPEESSLLEKMAERADLAPQIVERLIFKISESYGRYLTERFNLAPDFNSYIISQAKRSVFNAMLETSRHNEIENYLKQLEKNDGLNSDLMLTYLQQGHFKLFVCALAIKIDKPFEVVEQALATGNESALARLLERAHLSKAVAGALVIAYRRLFRNS